MNKSDLKDYAVVGKPIRRVDGPAKVTGKATYAGDLLLPGTLHGKILRSPYAHARILNIDYSRAMKLHGVRAVVTGRDFPGVRYGFMPQTRDQLPMATDKVKHYGEAVAAVAAIDEDIAEEALDLIDVEYEELTPVLTIDDAMKEGAVIIHDHMDTNIAASSKMHFGDVEKGFKESDYIREEKFTTQRVSIGFIEPHAVIVNVDNSGNVLIQGSKQSPYITWRHFCRAMDLPLGKVRIINPYVGGGFSGKHEALDLDFAAAALSKKTGFPVKIVLSQDEVIAAFKQRHAKHVEIKIGMKKDGTLVACECKMIAEGGAYASVGPFNIVIFATSGLLLPYRMSHFKYEAHRVYTNKPWCGSVRGQSIPIARFAFESLFNMMIDDLGLDQLEVRKKNSILSGESTINKMTVGTAGMVEAIEKLGEMIGWDGRKKKKAPYRGIGIACSPQVSGARMGGHFGSSAVVKVDEDGGVCLIHGGTEIGQGCDTVLAQMAAEVIGVPVEEIRQMEEDSDVAVLEAGMFSSRCTFWAGHAVKRAAEDACQQLAEIAAPLLEASKDDIVFKNKTVFSRKNPGRAIAFIDLVRNAYYTKGQPIYGRGSYSASNIPMPDLKTGEGDVTNAWAFFAQAVEVEVDPETGRVKVLKSVCTRDVGRPINPMLLDAQLEGGTVFTSGQALYEECCFDEKGRPLQNSFLDYKMPTVMEAPENEHFDIITDDPNGPFGAKGAGEGSNGTTLAAIANAVEDAIGVRIKDLPITPEKILAILKQRR